MLFRSPMMGSGFTSKYPLDRSVDLFGAAQPDLGKTMKTEYYGVSFDSSARIQTVPFIKVENQIGQGLRDENLCTGLDDPSCSATKGWQTIFIEGGIGNCAANPNTACVESFTITTPEGKEIIAKPRPEARREAPPASISSTRLRGPAHRRPAGRRTRSEEHTSELQSH